MPGETEEFLWITTSGEKTPTLEIFDRLIHRISTKNRPRFTIHGIPPYKKLEHTATKGHNGFIHSLNGNELVANADHHHSRTQHRSVKQAENSPIFSYFSRRGSPREGNQVQTNTAEDTGQGAGSLERERSSGKDDAFMTLSSM